MALSRRHKYSIILLSIYWPAIFILTHIPVPRIAGYSGMSDKTMHFLAYLALIFFLWLAFSPYQGVNWKKLKVWMLFTVIIWYGVVDEWLQGFVGRNSDPADFLADMTGAVLGLLILSIFSFWPASLLISAVFIFTFSNLSKIDMLWYFPHINIWFHFAAYTCFTLIWIQYMYRYIKLAPEKLTQPKWLLSAFIVPATLLAVVKLSSIPFDKKIWPMDCAVALTAIAATVLTSYFTFLTFSGEPDQQEQTDGIADHL